jgi:predicted DCC family thiol-disulfide oxidoreductase YuxK
MVERNNKGKRIYFAPLQGTTASTLFPSSTTENPESILYRRKGVLYSGSTAAIMVAGDMSGIWPIVKVLILVPRFIRDNIYFFIARNRYKWFGKKEQCMIPKPEQKLQYLP